MKEIKKVRNKGLTIWVNEKEYNTIHDLYKKTTSQSISEFARNILLKKPVIIKYRNQSADEFLSEMIVLKNELNAIGNNYSQAVHRLHILDRIPEIKTWLLIHEALYKSFSKKVEEIKIQMNQIYQSWLQK
jgi:hypothetical protein